MHKIDLYIDENSFSEFTSTKVVNSAEKELKKGQSSWIYQFPGLHVGILVGYGWELCHLLMHEVLWNDINKETQITLSLKLNDIG